jgi:hypothetical protein
MKKLFVLFAAAVSMAVAAQTHRVTLFQETIVNGTTLKPGDYKVIVDDNKVVLEKGKNRAEAQVAVETADSKFGSTSVRYQNGDGQYRIKEIRIGGTNTKLVFNN